MSDNLISNEQFSWRCPTCKDTLFLEGKQWRCKSNHCFDIAKQGYVNLLLAHHKNSSQPGDNADMVKARRDFLSQGHYAPLAEKVSFLIANHSYRDSINILDIGCGEGDYSLRISRSVALQTISKHVKGIDISKSAVQMAARSNKAADFAVASAFKLPLFKDCVDVAIQIFSPSDEQEVARVLKSKGLWICANPGPEHLWQMKELVYQTPQEHRLNDEIPTGFSELSRESLVFDIALSDAQCRENLLAMTPFFWSISSDKKAMLREKLALVTASFDVRVLICLP